MTNQTAEADVKAADELCAQIDRLPEKWRGTVMRGMLAFMTNLAAEGATDNEEPKETNQSTETSPE